jgi:ubiquinone/menaquinone biosynthesis C-methylase UbiE
MITDTELAVAERLGQLFQHLGIAQAHVAARLTADWGGLAATRPECFASLTLVCPTTMDAEALRPLAARLLVVTGDQGAPAEAVQGAMAILPGATLVTLRDYFGHPRADILVDRTEEIGAPMLAFLAHIEQEHPLQTVPLTAEAGEVAGISYRIWGAGPPLLLLPLGLAASQWEPLLPRLGERYCTITLGGAVLGSVASLETRGQSTGYAGVIRTMLEESHLQPGETVLDVGCGSGVLDRWLARHTGGANRIVAVDIHRTLLREAMALAQKEGLEGIIEFREGNAEALPFPDNSFDVVMSATVMELLDADRMLRELVRVAKPGGRVAVVVRAVDMHSFVNLPLRAALKARVEALPNGTAGAHGCADASLYRRFREAGLRHIKMLPQLATYDGAHAHAFHERVLTALSPEEQHEWHTAIAQAEAAGPFFVALPFHCAVGTKLS